MNYVIDPSDLRPAYLQLYYQLARDITAGVIPNGARLPSRRTLAAQAGVSVITSQHALDILCDEGYAESRPRSGCFAVLRQEAVPSQIAPGELSPVSANQEQQPLRKGDFPFTVLSRAMRKVLLDRGDELLVRSPNQGCMELRRQLSAYLARSRGIQIHPESIVIGSGAEYLYGLIAQMLGRERIYALEVPCYHRIQQVYEAFGIQCDLLPLTGDGIPASLLASTPATVLHVTPFNSYPSGITVDISKKQEYLSWARSHAAVIIEDNHDSELTIAHKAEDALFQLDGGQRVIYLNTFSRTIAPSLRVGYMLLPQAVRELFFEKLSFYSCTVPVFDQYVLCELLRSGDFERHINRVRRQKRKELKNDGK